MTTKTDLSAKSGKRELNITRNFNGTRDRVFNAWTDPKQMARWWGPKGFTNPVCELDVRPGGLIRIDMRGPDGTMYPMKGVFHEIAWATRLVFTSSALEDEEGNSQLEVLNTVTFAAAGKKTRLTLVAAIVKSMPAAETALAGIEEGWNQSLDRLAELLD